MASEIVALRSTRERDGTVRWRVFYKFPISPRIQNASAVDVVPQSSAGIPPEALQHFTIPEQDAMKAAVDVGDLGYVTREVDQTPGETNASFATRIKLQWAAIRDRQVAQWREEYEKTGTKINAP